MNSLVSYLEKANTGVRGRVVDQDGKPVKEANILVKRDDNPWRDSWLTTNKYVTPGRPKYSPPLLKTENNTKIPASLLKCFYLAHLLGQAIFWGTFQVSMIFKKNLEQDLSGEVMSGHSERTLPCVVDLGFWPKIARNSLSGAQFYSNYAW